jgi:hypothetical protein
VGSEKEEELADATDVAMEVAAEVPIAEPLGTGALPAGPVAAAGPAPDIHVGTAAWAVLPAHVERDVGAGLVYAVDAGMVKSDQ